MLELDETTGAEPEVDRGVLLLLGTWVVMPEVADTTGAVTFDDSDVVGWPSALEIADDPEDKVEAEEFSNEVFEGLAPTLLAIMPLKLVEPPPPCVELNPVAEAPELPADVLVAF